jgi:hypothetical protein
MNNNQIISRPFSFWRITEQLIQHGNWFEDCRESVQKIEDKLKFLNAAFNQRQASGGLQQNSYANLDEQIKVELKNQHEMRGRLNSLTQKIMELIKTHISSCEHSMGLLMKNLNDWKTEQKIAQYGGDYPKDRLSRIAQQFKDFWKNFLPCLRLAQNMVPTMSLLFPSWNFDTVLNKVLFIGQQILNTSFFVVEQPPMLVKSQLTVKVGLLSMENSGIDTLTTQCRIISEEIATEIKNNRLEITDELPTIGTIGTSKIAERVCTPIVVDSMGFEYRKININVDSRKTNNKDGNAIKTKYILLFNTNVAVLGTVMKLGTLSLPFMLSVHGSQDANLMATALWDMAFSQSFDNIPMRGLPSVPWTQLSDGLKKFFSYFTKLKVKEGDSRLGNRDRGLNDSDLAYLKSRLFNGQAPMDPNPTISWDMFFDKHLLHIPSNPTVELPITFWSWFFSIANMLQEKPGDKTRMKALWDAEFIHGFVSKEQAEPLLKSQKQPTFLIRFSENHTASVSFVICYSKSPAPALHLRPFKSNDLIEKLSLPGLIVACKDLKSVDYVYPDKRKSDIQEYIPTKQASSPAGMYDPTYVQSSFEFSEVLRTKPNAQACVARKRTRSTKQEIDRKISSTSTASAHSNPGGSPPPYLAQDAVHVSSTATVLSNDPTLPKSLSNPIDWTFIEQQMAINNIAVTEVAGDPLIDDNNDFPLYTLDENQDFIDYDNPDIEMDS